MASHSVSPGQGPSVAKMQQRAASPAGTACVAPGGAVVQQQSVAAPGGQPTRASSAPRAPGSLGQHIAAPQPCGSNVRTTSQPMSATSAHQQRQPQAPGSGGYLPGSPPPTSPMASSPAGQQPHYGHCSPAMVFPVSPAVRGASPAPAQVGAMQMAVGPRGTLGGHAGGAARNPSPIGLAGPSSPAGNVCMGGQSFGGVPARPDTLGGTTRGRSPPPTVAAGPGSGAAAARQPRAVTPSSLVKGITQGIHAGGMVQRGSLGPATVHRAAH